MVIADEDLDKLSPKNKKEMILEVLKRPTLGVIFNSSFEGK
jgi:hypothetical protein